MPRVRGQIHSTRKIGIAMLTTAWLIVSHTAHTQFTSNHRPYQPSVPRSIQPGSKNDFTARPSSMIPYAAPRRRMLGHPVFHRTAVSRMTRTPAPYSQIRRSGVIGFNHSTGGEDPESISAMIGESRMRARRGRRFGCTVAIEDDVPFWTLKGRRNSVAPRANGSGRSPVRKSPTECFLPASGWWSRGERQPLSPLGQGPAGVSRGPKVPGRSRARSRPRPPSGSGGEFRLEPFRAVPPRLPDIRARFGDLRGRSGLHPEPGYRLWRSHLSRRLVVRRCAGGRRRHCWSEPFRLPQPGAVHLEGCIHSREESALPLNSAGRIDAPSTNVETALSCRTVGAGCGSQ